MFALSFWYKTSRVCGNFSRIRLTNFDQSSTRRAMFIKTISGRSQSVWETAYSVSLGIVPTSK